MDVKDAVGNILLVATLLWWVIDGLRRDNTEIHMLASDLIFDFENHFEYSPQ